VAKDRIETVIALAAPVELGVTAEGSHAAASTKALAEVASLVASERIEVPIAATYLWARVREAYDQLELRHTCGEIVLIP
jgi:NADPH:quinone reductase-like Zn-dependent oxidoreductase